MNKKEEQKVKDQIVKLIGSTIQDSDLILVNDLVDWIRISEKAKAELQEAIKDNGSMPWQILTTIAMSSKQIQSNMNKLNITPEKRAKQKKDDSKDGFNLDRFLNEN